LWLADKIIEVVKDEKKIADKVFRIAQEKITG
jgi:hypothetical protein